jgi:hypothetical protein
MRITCSQCGAQVEVGPVDRFVACAHCGSSLLIAGGRAFAPVMVMPLLDAAQARAADEEPRAGRVGGNRDELLFVPYWAEASRLSLACPTLEAAGGLPVLRPPPGGQIQFRQDGPSQRIPDEWFLDPEDLPAGPGPPPGLVYLPYYRIEWMDRVGDLRECWVDGLDGRVSGQEDAPASADVPIWKDIGWCMTIGIGPSLVALLGAPWWLAASAGFLPALAYLVYRSEG